MKIKISPILTAVSCLVLFFSCKKTPTIPGGTNTQATVYVLGADSIYHFAYWKNGVAASVPATIATSGAFYVSGNNIYAAGGNNIYLGEGRTGNADYWVNGVVKALPAATSYAFARAIFASGADVYAAGETYYPQQLTVPFTTTTASYPTSGYVATYWKNGVAATLPSEGVVSEANGFGITNYADYISGMFVSGNDVYIAGGSHNFKTGVDSSFHPASYWKNGVPTELGNGLVDIATSFNNVPTTTAIYVAGSDVYVAGFESSPTNEQMALYWKNGVATFLTNPNVSQAAAESIFVSGSDVYVAGYETINGSTYATYWKNGVATDFSASGIPSSAQSIFISGNDIYLAGTENINGTIYAVYWKNGVAVKLAANSTAGSILVE